MKQLYLLLLLLFFSSVVFSQKKFEFGFAVKAGNYMLPLSAAKEHNNRAYEAGWRPGFSSQYGVFIRKKIGQRFALSSELLYQFVQVSKWEEIRIIETDAFFPTSVNAGTSTTVLESNLVVPLQIHFKPLKWEKTSFHIGVAAVFNLHSKASVESEDYPINDTHSALFIYDCDCFTLAPFDAQEITLYRALPGKPRNQILLGGGVQYRLSAHTSIGADLLLSPQNNSRDCELFLGWDCCTPALGYNVTPNGKDRYPIYMRSLSISLRHNILR
jgi:hypothetical protein